MFRGDLNKPTDDVVYLEVAGMTRGVTLPSAYILLMCERGSRRHVPLLIESGDAELLRRVMLDNDFTVVEPVLRLADTFGLRPVNVSLEPDGRLSYVSKVRFGSEEAGFKEVPLGFGVGIGIALKTNTPIRMNRNDFDEQRGHQRGEGMVAFSISRMSDTLLQEALQAAVEDENFELASQIRDEIKSRE